MILIDGKKAAAALRNELKKEVSDLKNKFNKVPKLTVILIGTLHQAKSMLEIKKNLPMKWV